MIALYIVLGIVALLTIILVTPVCLTTRYASGGQLRMTLRILGIPIRLLPMRKAPKKQAEAPPTQKAEKTTKKKKKEKKPKESPLAELQRLFKEDGLSATLAYLKQFAQMAKKAGKRLCRSVTIRRLRVLIRMGGNEAGQTAIDYGRVCGAAYPAVYLLSEWFKIKERQVEISPDFRREDTAVDLDVRVHILPARIVWAAICFLVRLMMITAREKAVTQESQKKQQQQKQKTGGIQHG